MEFERTVQVLTDARVDVVVIGGLCEAMHGCTTGTTLELGLCYSQDPANLKRLIAALAPFHPRPRGFPEAFAFAWDETMLRNTSVLALHTDLGEIDLLAEVAGLGRWDEVIARSISVEAFDRTIFILDLPSLIQAKRAAGREKDLAALPELESLLEATEP